MQERDHAVVVGGGMAGLLAARVLSESFARVTVVERDALPKDAEPRRGVPQGRHVHGYQARGVEITNELFPGLVAEAAEEGAAVVADLARCHFSPGGHRLSQDAWPVAPMLFASRPFLEHAVRRRVCALPGVTVLDDTVVTGLLRDAPSDGAAVSVLGVRVTGAGDDGAERPLVAELVVDASGRSSRVPRWLPMLGYQRPEEERVTVRIRYASQQLRLPPALYPRDMVIEGRTPTRPLGMALFGCERDSWTLTLMGSDQSPPPTDREGMLEAVSRLAPRWAAEAVAAAEPLGPVATHAFPASVRHRYDRLADFPRGLLVFGDAMCSFNPIYGQGMTVAAEQALALRAALAAGSDHDLALRFFRAAAAPVTNAWRLAVGSDLAMPGVEGPRPLGMRLSSWYVARVLGAAERDPEVARRFLRVAGLVDQPTALFSPIVVGRVLGAAFRPAGARGPEVAREAAVVG
jgi:2-polyprenyl-6-methoxyphenol hydroxylase-like FAD-dependent oxidoreductase